MTPSSSGSNLRRNRIIAWAAVIFSTVALLATQPKSLIVLSVLFFCLLGGLIWILVIGVRLRRLDVRPTHQEAAFWRVVFLWIFSVLNVAVCFYYGLQNWHSWWGSTLMALLSAGSAILLWRESKWAKYPLYAVTLYLALGALGGGIYNYLQYPALLQQPVKQQIIGWLIPGIPTALLINCCLFVRRHGQLILFYGFISTGLLLLSQQVPAVQVASFHERVLETYNFVPHSLTKDEISKKSKQLDIF